MPDTHLREKVEREIHNYLMCECLISDKDNASLKLHQSRLIDNKKELTDKILALFPSEPKDIKNLEDAGYRAMRKYEEKLADLQSELSSLKARMDVGEIVRILDMAEIRSNHLRATKEENALAIVKHLKGERV